RGRLRHAVRALPPPPRALLPLDRAPRRGRPRRGAERDGEGARRPAPERRRPPPPAVAVSHRAQRGDHPAARSARARRARRRPRGAGRRSARRAARARTPRADAGERSRVAGTAARGSLGAGGRGSLPRGDRRGDRDVRRARQARRLSSPRRADRRRVGPRRGLLGHPRAARRGRRPAPPGARGPRPPARLRRLPRLGRGAPAPPHRTAGGVTAARRLVSLLLAGSQLAAPAVAGAVTVGLADQKPASYADPRARALGLRYARLSVPYDAATSAPAQVEAWLSAVQGAGMAPHVAFEHLRTDDCPGAPCTLPSRGRYGAAVRA